MCSLLKIGLTQIFAILGASGNVATEDVIYLLTGLGISHGVDIDKLAKAQIYIDAALKRQVFHFHIDNCNLFINFLF